jgi:hypothetical protein
MPFVVYLAAFFAGAFLANSIPHLVKGICGDPFPTPFAKPPGRGLSSPPVNAAWGLLNLALGYWLLHPGMVAYDHPVPIALFALGFIALTMMCAVSFQRKHAA